MFQCLHFWGWKSLERPPRRGETSTDDELAMFQMTMCSVLVRRPGQLYLPGTLSASSQPQAVSSVVNVVKRHLDTNA